ncbi:hypothetical protein [Porphyromonas cangingivalis]
MFFSVASLGYLMSIAKSFMSCLSPFL